MSSDRCPSPEDWAVFAAGASSEAEWRRDVRHLAECELCRRQAAVLAQAEGRILPPASVQPPPPPLAVRVSRSPWRVVARLAAAAAVVVALATALRLMKDTKAPQESAAVNSMPSIPARPKNPTPLPQWPEGLKPRPVEPDSAPVKRQIFPPPPGLEPEDPVPPPAPVAIPKTLEPAPVPAPPPSPYLAQHAGVGVAETIQVIPAAGTVMLEVDAKSEALSKMTTVRPSQPLRTLEARPFSLPDGSTVHLGARSCRLRA